MTPTEENQGGGHFLSYTLASQELCPRNAKQNIQAVNTSQLEPKNPWPSRDLSSPESVHQCKGLHEMLLKHAHFFHLFPRGLLLKCLPASTLRYNTTGAGPSAEKEEPGMKLDRL